MIRSVSIAFPAFCTPKGSRERTSGIERNSPQIIENHADFRFDEGYTTPPGTSGLLALDWE